MIFVTEDDSQSGWDHVSAYRSGALVISPYSLRHKTISANYNQTSMVRTIELILGLPPMNIIDATATPMFDCFENSKKVYTFSCLPNIIPLTEMNKPLSQLKSKALKMAKLSGLAFKERDGGNDDEMNKILWFDAKGDVMYPSSK